MSDIIFKYPYDRTAASITNKVVGEAHTIGTTRMRLFATDYGPFYGGTEVIIEADGGYELKRGEDYRLMHPYDEARRRTGRPVYAVVQVTNPNIKTQLLFTGQMVGGEFSFSTYAIKQAILELMADDRPIYYGDLVGIPSQFVPAPHLHSGYDLYGLKALVESNADIAAAIREGDVGSRMLLLQQIQLKLETYDAAFMGICDEFALAAQELAAL